MCENATLHGHGGHLSSQVGPHGATPDDVLSFKVARAVVGPVGTGQQDVDQPGSLHRDSAPIAVCGRAVQKCASIDCDGDIGIEFVKYTKDAARFDSAEVGKRQACARRIMSGATRASALMESKEHTDE